MAATNYTPIQLYRTTTAAATPSAGNLAAGELAINLTDEKLYFKNAAGVVKLLASSGGAVGTVSSVDVSGGTTGLTTSGGPITTSGTITLAGTLGVANGGTGATSLTSGYLVKGNGTSAASASVVYDDGTNVGIGTSNPLRKLDIAGGGLAFTEAGGSSRSINWGDTTNIYPVTITGNATSGNCFITFNTNTFGSGATERMRIDSSGNVGIGVTPSAKLDVNGLGWFRANASANGVDILGRSSDNAGQLRILTNNAASTLATLASYGNDVALLNNTASYSLLLGTNSTERMRITAAGDVGIGTSSPANKLDVNGTAGASAYLLNGSSHLIYSGSSTEIAFRIGASGPYYGIGTTGSSNMRINSASGGDMLFAIGGTTYATLQNTTGNFGVGTSSPGVAVDVYRNTAATASYRIQNANTAYDSNFLASDGSGSAAFGYAGSTYGGYQGIVAAGSYWYATGAGGISLTTWNASAAIKFFTNSGSERMRIDSSGNVGIGTSAPNFARLQVSASGAEGFEFAPALSAGVNRILAYNRSANSYVTLRLDGSTQEFYTNGAERMRITSAGNVGIGTASPSSKLHVAGALTLDTALSAANGGTGLTSPGTSGNVLTSNGSAWVSSAPSGSANLQEFTSSGTWTKPSGATFVMVECWGAGGGGASGSARGTAGTNRSGGGGGGGGAYSYRVFKASDLGATESITIGAGGTGGAAQVSGGGAIGNDGGNTSFGTKLLAYGGGGALLSSGGGGGGVLSAAVSITAGEPFTSATTAGDFGGGSYTAPPSGFGAGAGGNGNTSGTASSAGGCSYQGGAGGGAGSGLNTSNNPTNAAAGGYNAGRTGGGGATNFFAAGSAGSALGMGGGGGWGNTGANAFAGGNGGIAAGGGGGGAGHNGNSGAGGNGGNGFCRVYSW